MDSKKHLDSGGFERGVGSAPGSTIPAVSTGDSGADLYQRYRRWRVGGAWRSEGGCGSSQAAPLLSPYNASVPCA
eukprot:2471443-Rhodomonas_salina.1